MPVPSTLDEMLEVSAYQELRKTVAQSTSRIVAVVGAGLSSSAGLPTWPKLRARLVEELRQQASRMASSTDAQEVAQNADDIARLTSYWRSFERLEKALGSTTYRGEILSALSPADDAIIPSAYNALWSAPFQGVVTVNLDSLAKRGFSEVYPGVELKTFNGKDAARLQQILHGGRKFAINLHGYTDDPESWVFTESQLTSLYRSPGYGELLTNIFTSFTVVFIGISADDMSLGSPLETLAKKRIQGATHYWITDRNDQASAEWAEKVGIRKLVYSAQKGHGLVEGMLHDLATATAPEPAAPPVILDVQSVSNSPMPDPETLVTMPLEQIREILNRHASQLLKETGGERRFEDFVEEYDEAIHRAWYTAARGKNTLFGYTLEESIARGAFGQVYRASDPAGNPVAVKVLLTEIRSDMELLKSFRRGVNAMRILEKHHVNGMVAYREASEIPAFVTMEWIDGPNLAEAKHAGLLHDWDRVLWVSQNLVDIIARAHALPEGVLHRDIRPANVMLRSGWLDIEEWQVVVLDFDLSTFRGARQKSVLAEGSALGFLAPEQLEKIAKSSTRNAAVDSFGLGMTLLFLCSGIEPEAYMQRRANFEQLVKSAVRQPLELRWKSLPHRYFHLICGATREDQSQRWGIARILHEIRRLQAAQDSPESVADADLIANEIAARCGAISDNYRWDELRESVCFRSASGLELEIRAPQEADSLRLVIEWAASGAEDRSKLAKYVIERSQSAAASLRGGPWSDVILTPEKHSFRIAASLRARVAGTRVDQAVKSLDTAISRLSFADV